MFSFTFSIFFHSCYQYKSKKCFETTYYPEWIEQPLNKPTDYSQHYQKSNSAQVYRETPVFQSLWIPATSLYRKKHNQHKIKSMKSLCADLNVRELLKITQRHRKSQTVCSKKCKYYIQAQLFSSKSSNS